MAELVYGVAIEPATGEVDQERTDALRKEIRDSRKKRGIPAKNYLTKERERIISGELPEMAISCLNECLANSEKFQNQFRQFWDLDEAFTHIRSKK